MIDMACKYNSRKDNATFSLIIDNYDIVESNLETLKPYMNDVAFTYTGKELFETIRERNPSQEELEKLIQLAIARYYEI